MSHPPFRLLGNGICEKKTLVSIQGNEPSIIKTMMIEPVKPPQLTPEQQQALEASNGLLQGDSYVLIRNDVVLDWFGYSMEELQKELQPAIEQAERREFVEFNFEAFITEMHTRHGFRSE